MAGTSLGFNHSLWIADENGAIYYVKRMGDSPNQLVGYMVSAPSNQFDFDTLDELISGGFYQPIGKRRDRSVAIVKMLLAAGVTAAAIPQDAIDAGEDDDGNPVTILGTSYIVNLASFHKSHAFWPTTSTRKVRITSPKRPGAKDD
jgi:hypothetical protein